MSTVMLKMKLDGQQRDFLVGNMTLRFRDGIVSAAHGYQTPEGINESPAQAIAKLDAALNPAPEVSSEITLTCESNGKPWPLDPKRISGLERRGDLTKMTLTGIGGPWHFTETPQEIIAKIAASTHPRGPGDVTVDESLAGMVDALDGGPGILCLCRDGSGSVRKGPGWHLKQELVSWPEVRCMKAAIASLKSDRACSGCGEIMRDWAHFQGHECKPDPPSPLQVSHDRLLRLARDLVNDKHLIVGAFSTIRTAEALLKEKSAT